MAKYYIAATIKSYTTRDNARNLVRGKYEDVPYDACMRTYETKEEGLNALAGFEPEIEYKLGGSRKFYRTDYALFAENNGEDEWIADTETPEKVLIAARIRNSDEWNEDDCRELCEMAGIEDEFEEADGEGFEAVIFKVAEILGVKIQ